MDINSLVYSDAALDVIDNGAWVGDIPGFEGVRLKVTGWQSPAAKKAVEAKQAEARKKNKGEALTADQHKTINTEVLADFVLKDWEGFTSDGVPVPFDAKKAKEWITSRNGEKLAGIVFFAANKIDADAHAFVEAVTKN